MSLENEVGPQSVQPNAELESLVDRLVEQTIARIGHQALKPFINSKECAALLGVTPEHLCTMRAHGEGPPWSGSGKWTRYQRSGVLAWLANLPRETHSPADLPLATHTAQPNSDVGNGGGDND